MSDVNGNTALARIPSTGSEAIERAVADGDLSSLSPAHRVTYYRAVCESVGLNPLTKPFLYLRLNGKLVLYTTKDCTDQLRKKHGISIKLPAAAIEDGVYVQTALASTPEGRCDESKGAVPIEGLKGEARANAIMKAETKAKRRATLSICGLGLLDESELDTIPGVRTIEHDPETGEIRDPGPGAAAAAAVASARFDMRRAQIMQAPDLATLKKIQPRVNADQEGGAITLDQRAQLKQLIAARKLALEDAAKASTKAEAERALDVGSDPAGLVGKGRVIDSPSGRTTFAPGWDEADAPPPEDEERAAIEGR